MLHFAAYRESELKELPVEYRYSFLLLKRRSDAIYCKMTESNASTTKHAWTAHEDSLLLAHVPRNIESSRISSKQWSAVSQFVPNRSSKMCRDRFLHHLDETVKKMPYSREEELILFTQQVRSM